MSASVRCGICSVDGYVLDDSGTAMVPCPRCYTAHVADHERWECPNGHGAWIGYSRIQHWERGVEWCPECGSDCVLNDGWKA